MITELDNQSAIAHGIGSIITVLSLAVTRLIY
jgi:hypothetical protein